MQLYLKPFFNILRQQNNFEWTTEHRKRFDEIKTLLMNNYQAVFQIPTNHFMPCATPQTLDSAQH